MSKQSLNKEDLQKWFGDSTSNSLEFSFEDWKNLADGVEYLQQLVSKTTKLDLTLMSLLRWEL